MSNLSNIIKVLEKLAISTPVTDRINKQRAMDAAQTQIGLDTYNKQTANNPFDPKQLPKKDYAGRDQNFPEFTGKTQGEFRTWQNDRDAYMKEQDQLRSAERQKIDRGAAQYDIMRQRQLEQANRRVAPSRNPQYSSVEKAKADEYNNYVANQKAKNYFNSPEYKQFLANNPAAKAKFDNLVASGKITPTGQQAPQTQIAQNTTPTPPTATPTTAPTAQPAPSAPPTATQTSNTTPGQPVAANTTPSLNIPSAPQTGGAFEPKKLSLSETNTPSSPMGMSPQKTAQIKVALMKLKASKTSNYSDEFLDKAAEDTDLLIKAAAEEIALFHQGMADELSKKGYSSDFVEGFLKEANVRTPFFRGKRAAGLGTTGALGGLAGGLSIGGIPGALIGGLLGGVGGGAIGGLGLKRSILPLGALAAGGLAYGANQAGLFGASQAVDASGMQADRNRLLGGINNQTIGALGGMALTNLLAGSLGINPGLLGSLAGGVAGSQLIPKLINKWKDPYGYGENRIPDMTAAFNRNTPNVVS